MFNWFLKYINNAGEFLNFSGLVAIASDCKIRLANGRYLV